MRHVLIFLAVCFGLCACPTNGGILNPPTGSGTPYPCGLQERQCLSGRCCSESEQCSEAGTSCPEGMCCYAGGDLMMARRDAEAQPANHPQRKP